MRCVSCSMTLSLPDSLDSLAGVCGAANSRAHQHPQGQLPSGCFCALQHERRAISSTPVPSCSQQVQLHIICSGCAQIKAKVSKGKRSVESRLRIMTPVYQKTILLWSAAFFYVCDRSSISVSSNLDSKRKRQCQETTVFGTPPTWQFSLAPPTPASLLERNPARCGGDHARR